MAFAPPKSGGASEEALKKMYVRSTMGNQRYNSAMRSQPVYGFGTATRAQALKSSIPPPGIESPGPAYTIVPAIGPQVDGRLKSLPRFSQGTATREQALKSTIPPPGLESPGPAHCEGVVLDASYKHALQSAPIPPSLAGYSSRKQADAVFLSKELDKISRAGVEGPGPAAYNLTPFSLGKQVKAGRLRSAPQWGFGTGSTEFGSSFASQKVRSPGPAAYNFNLNTYDEVPKAGFGTATRVQALKTSVPPKGWESPGPIYGAPDPQSSACQEKRPATYSFGTGSRFSWYKEKPRRPDKSGKARPTFSEGPGPGAYNV